MALIQPAPLARRPAYPVHTIPIRKKRGLPEGYVRGLEKLWALSLCNIEGLEDRVLVMVALLPNLLSESRERWDCGRKTAHLRLHNSWKTSRLFSALETMLSNTDASQLPGKRSRIDQETWSTGADGEWEYRVGSSSAPLGDSAPRIVEPFTTSGVKRNKPSKSSDVQSPSSPSYLANDPTDALQLPPQSSRLLDTYFTVTHS